MFIILPSLPDDESVMLSSDLPRIDSTTPAFEIESDLSFSSNLSSALCTNQPLTSASFRSAPLSILMANFRSVKKNKQNYKLNKVDIILGTESHLDDSITNPEIFPGHYHT